jgi:predicted RNA-binding protein with PIN domain
MARVYLVDGYNFLQRSCQKLLAGRSLEGAREALARRMEDFLACSEPDAAVVLVFDGARGVPSRDLRSGRLTVRFSRPPQSADDAILAAVRVSEAPGDLCVVTSDYLDIARRLAGLRCRHLSCEAFAEEVASRTSRSEERGSVPGSGEKPAPPSPEEREGWLSDFGLGGEED